MAGGPHVGGLLAPTGWAIYGALAVQAMKKIIPLALAIVVLFTPRLARACEPTIMPMLIVGSDRIDRFAAADGYQAGAPVSNPMLQPVGQPARAAIGLSVSTDFAPHRKKDAIERACVPPQTDVVTLILLRGLKAMRGTKPPNWLPAPADLVSTPRL